MDATSHPYLDMFIKKEDDTGDAKYPNPGEGVSGDLQDNIKRETDLATVQQNINSYIVNDQGNTLDNKSLNGHLITTEMDPTPTLCLDTLIKKENDRAEERYLYPGQVVSWNLSENVKMESNLGRLQQNINSHDGNAKGNTLDNKSLTGMSTWDEGTFCTHTKINISEEATINHSKYVKEPKPDYEPLNCPATPDQITVHVSTVVPEKENADSDKFIKAEPILNVMKFDDECEEKKIYTDKQQPFKCEDCGKCFTQRGNLKVHMRAHTGEKPFKCEQCGKCFARQDKMKIHMRTHSGAKPYQCEICGQCFSQNSAFKIHKRKHTGEKPLKCGQCCKSFSDYSSLNYHTWTHNREKPFKCEQCGDCFPREDKLKNHMATHPGAKPFDCEICGKWFCRKGALKNHMRTHMGKKAKQILTVAKIVNEAEEKKIDTNNQQPFKCDYCGKCFTRRDKLNFHVRAHTGEKPFKCEQCGKCFSRQDKLKIHMRTHSGAKPYDCDICGKCFSQNSTLKQHKRTHTGEKPFKCGQCCKSFSDHSSLNYHKWTHNREKPFKCEQCGDCFPREDKLKNHMATHPGAKPFDCEICGKWFARKGVMKIHMRTHT